MIAQWTWLSQKLKVRSNFNGLPIERKSVRLRTSVLFVPIIGLLAACGSVSKTGSESQDAVKASGGPVSAMAIATTALSDPTAFKVGTNLNTISVNESSRPFMNLIYGTNWTLQNTAPWGGYEAVPAASLDGNGWIKSLPTGYRVVRGLSVPIAGGDIVCRYVGNGQLNVLSGPTSNVSSTAGLLKFTVAATNGSTRPNVAITYNYVDPTNYIRNIDCREAGTSSTANVAPEFTAAVNGFRVLRFMKWQTLYSTNGPITWTNRNKPGDGAYYGVRDGVPVEAMVEAANAANADPWFIVPWNADDDYITRFATYVRDNMASGHQAYVEVGNELWNGSSALYKIACQEAKDEALPAATDSTAIGCAGERYAERTRQVMAIWSTVFAGQSNRLVRVFAWQHVIPYWSDKLLAYQDTYKSVDALATAPYFGYNFTDTMSADDIIAALPGQATDAINYGVRQKAVAQKYGLRYVTYEGGQTVVLPTNVTLLAQVERDPRMYDVYKAFVAGWQSQIGDTLTLFALTGPINKYGAWGMSEYADQPLSETPKRRAVQEFLQLSTFTADAGTTTSSSTTQVCPDGSTILSTSTCPTTTTSPTTQVCSDGSIILSTSTCPAASTGSTTGGKKNGGTKGGGGGKGKGAASL